MFYFCVFIFELFYANIVTTYAKNLSSGKYSKLAIVEEEQCEDLLLFVELLGHHTTMLEEMGERRQVPENSVQLSDVILNGVCLLLSFVNGELLKVCVIN